MAVINEIPGLEVTVEVEGKRLEEYDCPPEKATNSPADEAASAQASSPSKPHHIIKYIKAETGANFGITFARHLNFQHESDHVAWKIWIDSKFQIFSSEPVSRKAYPFSRLIDYTAWRTSMEEEYACYKFKFADLRIVPDGDCTQEKIEQDKVAAAGLAVIKVKVFHMLPFVTVRAGHERGLGAISNAKDVDELAEKSLKGKAVSSYTSYKRSEPTFAWEDNDHNNPNRLVQKELYKDPRCRPFAVFEFRYRSKEGLVNECILPRDEVETPKTPPKYVRGLHYDLRQPPMQIQGSPVKYRRRAATDGEDGSPRSAKKRAVEGSGTRRRQWEEHRALDEVFMMDLKRDSD
ncbi:hypothetical protein BJ170DRAFT_724735 [Xylariales sp. AK1849]|nr:hypothetical protein BJ170DRAFT_724735 [Xylariales sp. AK1849]